MSALPRTPAANTSSHRTTHVVKRTGAYGKGLLADMRKGLTVPDSQSQSVVALEDISELEKLAAKAIGAPRRTPKRRGNKFSAAASQAPSAADPDQPPSLDLPGLDPSLSPDLLELPPLAPIDAAWPRTPPSDGLEPIPAPPPDDPTDDTTDDIPPTASLPEDERTAVADEQSAGYPQSEDVETNSSPISDVPDAAVVVSRDLPLSEDPPAVGAMLPPSNSDAARVNPDGDGFAPTEDVSINRARFEEPSPVDVTESNATPLQADADGNLVGPGGDGSKPGDEPPPVDVTESDVTPLPRGDDGNPVGPGGDSVEPTDDVRVDRARSEEPSPVDVTESDVTPLPGGDSLEPTDEPASVDVTESDVPPLPSGDDGNRVGPGGDSLELTDEPSPVDVTESGSPPVRGDGSLEPTDEPGPVGVWPSATLAVNEEEEEEGDVARPEAATNNLILEVDVSDAISESGSIEATPTRYYASIRASGFTRVLLRNLPADANLALVRQIVQAAGLELFTERSAGIIESPTASYPRGPDWSAFDDVLAGHDTYARRAGPGGASSALLLLPGLRVVQSDCAPALMSILRRDALQRGRFSLPEVHHRFSKMAVWKYATPSERILVCVNPTPGHAVADVVCPDAEGHDEKIDVIELMTETTYKRFPEEMKTAGLHVILFEDGVQVFLY